MSKNQVLVPMETMCPTCPFRPEGYTEVRSLLVERATSEATPICHSTGDTEIVPPEDRLDANPRACRGARNLQLQRFAKMGFITAPTDEAWFAKCKEMGLPTP
jgi:hypothetical protein